MSSAQLKRKISQGSMVDTCVVTDSAITLTELYRRHARDLRCYILAKWTGVDHEEVMQAVFFKLARMQVLPDLPHPRGYLFRAADHIVIDEGRKAIVRKKFLETKVHSAAEDLCDELTPERVVAGKLRLALVTRAIKRLDPERQRLLMLYRIGGLPYLEIARITKRPFSTVRREIIRAIQELNEIVRTMSNETEDDPSDS
ncbi:MAG: sigma-70 family RNA polymerase sigma factor [Kordiimonadaceae bacterium]|nr:sigma-70 family RNA polymerase sigma factor [Kordiimonadaceae bacterium]